MKRILLILSCSMVIVSSFAATVTWDDGGGDMDWMNPLNWDTDLIPTAADDVDLAGFDVVLSANTQVQRVFADGSGIFTVDAGITLTVDGFTGNDEGVEIQGSATLVNNGTIAISNILGGSGADGFYNKGTTTNNGTITIDGIAQHGLYVVAGVFTNTATGVITVTNSGMVTSDGDDIYVDDANSGTLFGELINDGTITINTTSGDDGINVNDDATFNNNAMITINGGGSDAIRTQDGGIFNNNAAGTVIINNSSDEAIQNDSPSTFNNLGTLDINTPGDHGMEIKSIFINSGTITIDDAADNGIYIIDAAMFTNTACGIMTITTSEDHAIQVDANNNGAPATLDNAGTIIVDASIDHAVRVQDAGVITNSGTLNILNSQRKALLVELDGILNNSCTVDISVTGIAGNDGEGFDLKDGTFNNLTGGIYRAKDCSDDGLELNGIFNNDGTIEIDGSGDDDIEAFASATISNTSNAVFNVGCPGIGDLEVKGNFDFGASTINIEISGTGPATEFDQILNFSSSNFITLSNATLNLDWGCYTPTVGDKYKVVDGSGLVIGDFATVTSSNPSIGYTKTNLGFEIEIEITEVTPTTFTALDDLCIDAGVQTGLGEGLPVGAEVSVPWVFENVTFDDGGVASGYIDYAGTPNPVDWEIVVSGGNTTNFPSVTYTPANSNSTFSNATLIMLTFNCGGGPFPSDRVIRFSTGMPWSTSGGSMIPLNLADSNGNTECYNCSPFRSISGGTVSGGIIATGVYSGPGVTDDGNGMTYSFDPATAGVGTHTITYTVGVPGCPDTEGFATDDVEVFDLPTASLSTALYYCEDAPISAISLVGGLPIGGVYSGVGVTDNGDGLGYLLDPTVNGVGTITITYTLTDGNGCSNSATSDIDIIDCGFDIVDPCACLDNATIFDCNDETGGDDGQFSEIVSITTADGSPLPAGQTWTIVGATGAFDAFNVPAVGVQSAGVPVAADGTVLLMYNSGVYEIPFVHVDDMGYTLMIEGPFGMGSPANVTLTISNKCQYPDPVFDPAIPAMINIADPAFTLGAMDSNGGTADAVTFTLDGGAAAMIDPSTLALGTHTVTMTYDGADDGNGGISPDGGTTSASPGCIQEVTKDFEIIECMLEVDCSNIIDMTLACRADLPAVDFALPIIDDSCGDVTPSALTIIPGDTGCPEDTLFITRTYFQQDAAGNMDQCMQTFTIISTMDPVFTSFPADTIVLCLASTDPADTGMAEGEGECDPANPQAVITFADIITPGACPQEMTITRTWTVTDRCDRAVDMDQIIMIVDTIPPTVVCQNITIELDADGMATADPADVDNGSSDNCGPTADVITSLSMTMFTCDNLGVNDVFFYGEDECGNIDSCMVVITVEDNIAPTITCPADIVMDNDPGVCGAVVTFVIVADDNCTPTVTQTAGIPSGGLYPVGETINTFMVTDDAGLTAECSFLVTVNDVEGPVIDCPGDIGVQLEAGECEEIVFFEVPFMDNCGTIDAEASQAINEMLINDAVDCTGNSSNHLRYFENSLLVPVEITEVNFGVFNTGTNETVTVNVYMIAPGATFIYANMVLMGTSDFMVPSGMNQMIMSVPLNATIPVGMDYVLELKANNTTNFLIGYNNQGETESTYISGNDPVPCVSLEPTDIDAFGPPFNGLAVVLYSNAEGGASIEQTEGLPSGSYFPSGTTTQTFIATDVFGNTSECTFDVNLVPFTNGVTGVLACNDNLNISLDQNCELVLLADMLLEGDVYGCYNDFDISISGGVTGNVITTPGTYTVTVTDPNTGNSCWSTINVEAKAAPILEDCACPVGGTEVMTPFIGTLDATDPIWTRPFEGAAGCAPSGAGVDIPYDTYSFELDMDATLGAEVVTFTAPSGDSFIALYADGFDATDPCANLVITNDDGGTGFLSAISVMLNAGVNYTLVVTTFNENGNDYGDYVVEITSDATLLEIGEECKFRCVDVDYVYNSSDLTPNPIATACEDFDLVFSDQLTTDDCGTTTILRTWIASNEHGSSTCVQEFLFDPIAITDLMLPTSPVELSCNDGVSPEDIVAIFDNPLTNDNPNTPYVENNEGYVHAYPTYLINGHPQKVDNNVCNLYAGYVDQELDACEEGCNGNRKVIRTWTLVDWCTLETSTYVQTIKAVDTEAPTLNTQDITVSTDAWGCGATFEVPLPWELHDNCDSAPKYDVSGPAGVSIEGTFETGFTAIGAQKGVNTFNYIAYDCCGNEASFPFTVTVADLTPPVVVAKQNIVVSLTSGSTSEDGLAKLYAESVDNGSFDGCSDNVKLEIRRDEDGCDVRGNATYNADGHPQDGSPNPNSPSYDPDGGAYVKFCCDDITAELVDVNGDGVNDAGYHKVWLRVWDDGDMDGVFGSAGDNFNEAWAYVKVEDKLAPAIQCPADVTLTCDMDYTDLDMTGEATAFGSCGGVPVEYNDIIINLNTCNEGFVRRRWNVVGRSDVFCDQTITIDDLNNADPIVSFSQVGDFTAAGCPADIAVGEPTWIAGPCDVLGYTVATDTFQFEDGACYKLVNTYTVINWCDYEPNNPFWDGSGIWEHTQVIKVTDETKPVIEDCEDKMFAINDHSDSDDDGIVCEASIVLTNSATDEGSANCPTGWLKWQVIIDLWGDGTPDLEYSSFLPPFDSQFNDTNGNGIGDVYVSPTANGGTVSIPLPDIEGSMSNHKVSWKVTDGCNNVTTCDSEFMVVDKKAPTPYCIDLSSAVMESGGTVELWAIDFNLGSFDNCSAQEALRYTFTDVAPEDDNSYDPTQRSSAQTFDCDDVANSPVEVNMYVWDEKGNADFCLVYLTLVDNTGVCGEGKMIAGNISTASGAGVNDVEATLSAALPEYPRTDMTDNAGDFAFDDAPLNANYQITASKDVDYLNGVSTLDLVKIQRHILGLEDLDSPYKLIAADINADNDIKASDLSQLRKLILGVITDLPTNESWRFVNGSQALDMDLDLEDVDYTIEIGNLQSDMLDNNMVAVKVGDVTENATVNAQGAENIEVRSAKTLELMIDNRAVKAGERVEVDFTSADFRDVFGYQFTMELNGLEMADVVSGAIEMTEGNVGMLSNEVVTVSYHNGTAKTATENESVFTMVFTATEDGQLSEMIDVTSKVTSAEIYLGNELEIRELVISTRGDITASADNNLYQNEPNPFKDQTMIRFELAEAGAVTFTVTDVAGKLLKTVNTAGIKGMNILPLDASDLGVTGILYYTIKSGEFTATKKMIIIR